MTGDKDDLFLPISDQAREAIEIMYRVPDWAHGYISWDDAAFLYQMVLRVQPPVVVEIGTAAGMSTSVLLHAQNAAGRRARSEPTSRPASQRPTVVSFDKHAHCYFNPAKRLGQAIGEVVPELEGNVRLCPAEGAGRVRTHFGSGTIELAFIDADHHHPYPALDVAAILPALAPGSWVILHDTGLSDFTDNPLWKNMHGPKYLLTHWSGEKCVPQPPPIWEGPPNVGAIRMPPEPMSMLPEILELLTLPWESDVKDAYLEDLGLRPREVPRPQMRAGRV